MKASSVIVCLLIGAVLLFFSSGWYGRSVERGATVERPMSRSAGRDGGDSDQELVVPVPTARVDASRDGEGSDAFVASQANSLVVVVESEASEPISEATVRVHMQEDSTLLAEGVSDRNGRATFSLDTTRHLRVEAINGVLRGERYNVVPGQSCTVRVREKLAVRVRTVDLRGVGVRDVQIQSRVGTRIEGQSLTGPSGVSPVMWLPVGKDVRFVARGAQILPAQIDVLAEEMRPVVQMTVEIGACTLVGFVTVNGRGIAGASVRDLRGEARRVQTNGQGRFEIGRYAMGDDVLLLASHPNHLFGTVRVTVEDELEEVSIELNPGDKLNVLVADERGHPIEGAELVATVRTGWADNPSAPPVDIQVVKEVQSNSAGVGVFDGMVGGVDLRVTHPLYNTAAMHVEEVGSVIVRMEGRTDWAWSVSLCADVKQRYGAEGWGITLTPLEEVAEEVGPRILGSSHFGVSGRDGRGILHGVPRGLYRAQVRAPGNVWVENMTLHIDGQAWTYLAPNRFLKVREDAGFVSERMVLYQSGIQSWFVASGQERVCFCTAGEWKIRVGGEVYDVNIPEGGSSVWLESLLAGEVVPLRQTPVRGR